MKLEDVAKDTLAYCKKDKKNSICIRLIDWNVTGGQPTTNIEVIARDYISLAYEAAEKYKSVAILNMCSDVKPGGGFLTGSTAGEEELCRRSTLYPQLLFFEYPFTEPQLIYSKDVEIFKAAQTYKRLKPTRHVDVISIAAIRRPALTEEGEYLNNEDIDSMRARVVAILSVAKEKGIECLVLSAFGSGAFRNPAAPVAQIFKWALQHFEFKSVVFGILDDTLRGRVTNNFEVYSQVFKK
jgi:uncharacterized protein (TIGR02452 family)